jgi:HemY protein
MLQSADKNWRGAAETLEGLRRSGALDEKTANRKRAVVLTGEAAEKEKSAPLEALQLALRAHKLDPSLVPATVIAARLYASQGQARKAARIIERTFAINPHVELVRVYAYQRPGAAPRERLKKAEQLVSRFGGGEEGAIGIAQAAIAAMDWTRAKTVLEPFLEDRPRARVCALMAEIAEGEGDKGAAREWLARGMRAPPDPKWTADGIVSDQWQPVSPVTGELGVFQWKVPVERLAYDSAETESAEAPDALPAPETAEVTVEDSQAGEPEGEGREEHSEPPRESGVTASQPPPAERPNVKVGVPDAAPVRFPLPDDPGPQREDDPIAGPSDDWARRLAGSS